MNRLNLGKHYMLRQVFQNTIVKTAFKTNAQISGEKKIKGIFFCSITLIHPPNNSFSYIYFMYRERSVTFYRVLFSFQVKLLLSVNVCLFSNLAS